MICVIAGYSGSGKSTFAGMLSHLTGLVAVNVGDLVRDHYLKMGHRRASRVDLGERYIRQYSGSELFGLIEPVLTAREAQLVDGLRVPGAFCALKRKFPEAVLLWIEADAKIRESRLRVVTRPDTEDPVQAAHKDDLVFGDGLEILRKAADKTVDNNGSLVDLQRHAERFAQHRVK